MATIPRLHPAAGRTARRQARGSTSTTTWRQLADDGPAARARATAGGTTSSSSSRRLPLGRAHRRTCSTGRWRCASASTRSVDAAICAAFKDKLLLVVGKAPLHARRLRDRQRRARLSRCAGGRRRPRDAARARCCPACAHGSSTASTAALPDKKTPSRRTCELLETGTTNLLPPLAEAAATARGAAARRQPRTCAAGPRARASLARRRKRTASCYAATASRRPPVRAPARHGAARHGHQRRPYVRAPAAAARPLPLAAAHRHRSA